QVWRDQKDRTASEIRDRGNFPRRLGGVLTPIHDGPLRAPETPDRGGREVEGDEAFPLGDKACRPQQAPSCGNDRTIGELKEGSAGCQQLGSLIEKQGLIVRGYRNKRNSRDDGCDPIDAARSQE